jgi:hypothetical protein
MNAESLEVQVLNFLQAIREAKELRPDHPSYTVVKEIEGLFTGSVDFLRGTFPNQPIRRLTSVMWEVVGHKIVPVGYGMGVPSLTFAVDGSVEAPRAVILSPKNWHEMVRQDPVTQLGAVVFVGSQAVDYANERFTVDPECVKTRALAYEAEYLLTVRSLSPEWEFGEYQRKIMEEFPEGLATPRAHKVVYPIKPLIQA